MKSNFHKIYTGAMGGNNFFKLFSALFFLAVSSLASAQQVNVAGIVSGSEDGQALIGVTIKEKGSTKGTSTDLEGRYQITVAPDAVLIFSYVGLETQELPVSGRSSLNVEMEPAGNVLNDVVVTGYRKEFKSEVSSAIATVKGKDLEKLVVLGIDQALQGQAAGVQITQTTGAPGDDIAVRIRGAGTLGNNNPLFIIDGVPTTGNINTFSVTDIESIEVLKDGAAAAIYGSRAANGVVLITTKKGKSGKPTFSFDAYTGFSEVNRLPELLNAREYLEIRNEAITNANALRNPANQLGTYNLAMLDTLPDNNCSSTALRCNAIRFQPRAAVKTAPIM